jgi:hypothetical protein
MHLLQRHCAVSITKAKAVWWTTVNETLKQSTQPLLEQLFRKDKELYPDAQGAVVEWDALEEREEEGENN